MKVTDDFKMVIVLDTALSLGLKTNTAAVLSLTLGNKIQGLIGEDLKDGGGDIHTGLTKIPLPILQCTNDVLVEIYNQAYNLKEQIFLVDITNAAQTTKNYDDYSQKLNQSSSQTLKLLGIGLAGNINLIKKLTGNLGLVR